MTVKLPRKSVLSSFFLSARVTLIMNRVILFSNTTITLICESMAACGRPRTLGLASIEKSSLAAELVRSEAERSALSF